MYGYVVGTILKFELLFATMLLYHLFVLKIVLVKLCTMSASSLICCLLALGLSVAELPLFPLVVPNCVCYSNTEF